MMLEASEYIFIEEMADYVGAIVWIEGELQEIFQKVLVNFSNFQLESSYNQLDPDVKSEIDALVATCAKLAKVHGESARSWASLIPISLPSYGSKDVVSHENLSKFSLATVAPELLNEAFNSKLSIEDKKRHFNDFIRPAIKAQLLKIENSFSSYLARSSINCDEPFINMLRHSILL
ncbi:MAG: hypothetical protein HKL80_12255, partial [Acidimicrobiales bacterium]|nr:hypothetical protein [Acidimicrobiales bacterium]